MKNIWIRFKRWITRQPKENWDELVFFTEPDD